MPEPLLLYSTNTWLAYMIAQTFYRGEHYVWCSPYFNALAVAPAERTIPPSSVPGKLYRQFYDDAFSGERHSDRIRLNRAGLRRGAVFKERAGVITEDQRLEINAIVARAQNIDFRPLVYVIPFAPVRDMITEVPVGERSHPLSRECRIERLPRSHFDIIDLHEGQTGL